MNIVIIDDNKIFLQHEEDIIKEIAKELNLNVNIKSYTDGHDFIEDESVYHYDLIFLDIDMPTINGFDVAEYIKGNFKDSFIVFMSNHEHLVYNSFEYFPLTFIRKSEAEREIKRVISHVMSLNTNKEKRICINNSQINLVCPVRNIIYVESIRTKVIVHTVDGEYINNKKISEMVIELEPFKFLHPHKCYLVNFDHIKSMSRDGFTLTQDFFIPISKHRAKEIKQEFREYVREMT